MKEQKVLDYRVKVFLVLVKSLKALKLFKVQKAVRKIRANEKPEQLPSLESQLSLFKSITAKDCRDLAYFVLQHRLKRNATQDFFVRQVPNHAAITENFLEESERLKKFMEAISDAKKYKDALEKVEETLQFVDKKQGKTKLRRVIKKQRFVLKRKEKEQRKLNEPTEISKQDPLPKKLVKPAQQKQTPSQTVATRKKEPFKELSHLPQRLPAQKQTIAITQQTPPDHSFQSLHPSWQAKIEQKQMIGNMNLFQGKKIKLN